MPTLSSSLPIALSAAALAAALFTLWQQKSLNRLRRTFFAGRTGSDLESVLLDLAHQLQSAREEQRITEQNLANLRHSFSFAVQKVGIVKFNPFGDGGGNFSFCLALLDGNNSGVVVTSMHGRQQNRIYSKNISLGTCEQALTDEEKKAIILANSQT